MPYHCGHRLIANELLTRKTSNRNHDRKLTVAIRANSQCIQMRIQPETRKICIQHFSFELKRRTFVGHVITYNDSERTASLRNSKIVARIRSVVDHADYITAYGKRNRPPT
jgi:hypothetical protein